MSRCWSIAVVNGVADPCGSGLVELSTASERRCQPPSVGNDV